MLTVSLSTLEGLTGRLITQGLVHSVWIGLLIGAFVAIAFRLRPSLSLASRHRLLAASMAIAVLAPIATVMVQRASYFGMPTPISAPMSVEVQPINEAIVMEVPLSDPGRQIPRQEQSPDSWESGLRALNWTIDVLERLQPLVLAAWLVGVATLCVRLGLGLMVIRRENWRTEPAPEAILARTRELAVAFKLRRVPAVRIHPGPIEPYLCGVFRPMIVLPAPWLKTAEAATIAAILSHELAHLKRRDLLANLLQRLIDTAFFFHPAVHWLSRSLRFERELCTDNLTVRITGDRISLANALESVARFRLASGHCFSSFVTPFGGEPPSLLPRIQELLGMMPSRTTRRSPWPWISIPVAGLFALMGATLGLAQDPIDVTQGTPRSVLDTEFSSPEVSARATPPSFTKVPLQADSVRRDATEGTRVAGRRLSLAEFTDRQISFEVRILSIADLGWRDFLGNHLQEVHRDDETTAWILDAEGTKDLVIAAQNYPRSSIVMAPKVTTFEGAQATINDLTKHTYVADLKKMEGPGSLMFRPVTQSYDVGRKIEVSGMIRGNSILMDLDARDQWLVTMLTGERKAILKGEPPLADATIRGEFQSPVLSSKRYKGTNTIPSGSTLMVSTGWYEVPSELPPMMNKAIGIVRAFVGGPRVQAERTTYERLVLVTPRPIILQPE